MDSASSTHPHIKLKNGDYAKALIGFSILLSILFATIYIILIKKSRTIDKKSVYLNMIRGFIRGCVLGAALGLITSLYKGYCLSDSLIFGSSSVIALGLSNALALTIAELIANPLALEIHNKFD